MLLRCVQKIGGPGGEDEEGEAAEGLRKQREGWQREMLPLRGCPLQGSLWLKNYRI